MSERSRACRRFLRQADDYRSGEVPEHLASCIGCQDEIRRERAAVAALHTAAVAMNFEAQEKGANSLSPERRRLILQTPERRPGLGWGLVPLLDWRPAMVVAAAAAVALTVGLGARALTPYASRPDADLRLASTGGGTDLQVVAEGSAVTLSWQADGRSVHRVIRATDPRDLAAGRVEVVRGSQWVDPDTNGSRVVYYVVD